MAQSSVSSILKASIPTTRYPWGRWTLVLLPYLPFGIFLCVWRICLSLQVIFLLLVFPEGVIKRYMLRIFFCMLGLMVTTEGCVSKNKLLISNKLSVLDHIALHLAAACITVSTGGKNPPLSPLFPHWTFPCTANAELQAAAKALPEFSEVGCVRDSTPYLVQPEPLPTTGTHSLLKFSEWPFSLGPCLQPVSLSLTRPFPLALSTVHSSGWTDLFFILFLPISIFHVRFLPVLYKTSDQSTEEFAASVQRSLAVSLGLQSSQLTLENISEWLKSRVPESSSLSTPVRSESTCNSDLSALHEAGSGVCSDAVCEEGGVEALESLVQQVMAVLPQVSHTIIRADLRATDSVDATITNLLEGLVQYTPSSSTPSTITPHTCTNPSVLRRRGNAVQRQLSLDERKKELLQIARTKYVQKHGL